MRRSPVGIKLDGPFVSALCLILIEFPLKDESERVFNGMGNVAGSVRILFMIPSVDTPLSEQSAEELQAILLYSRQQ